MKTIKDLITADRTGDLYKLSPEDMIEYYALVKPFAEKLSGITKKIKETMIDAGTPCAFTTPGFTYEVKDVSKTTEEIALDDAQLDDLLSAQDEVVTKRYRSIAVTVELDRKQLLKDKPEFIADHIIKSTEVTTKLACSKAKAVK